MTIHVGSNRDILIERLRLASNRKRIGKALAYLVCTLIGVGYIFPFYWMVATSLKADTEIFVWPPAWIPSTLHWENYPKTLNYIPFWLYMKNTMIIAVFSVLGTLISCSLVAYGFSRIQWPGREVIFIGYLSTMMLPFQVTMIPLFIVFKKLGWVGTYNPLIVPRFFGNVFYVFMLRQFFLTIPLELSDAGRIDGCSEFGIFRRIILPLARPALATVALFTFLFSYNDFLGPLIYLTHEEQWTISLGLQMFKNMYYQDWQMMMAASTMTMVPIVVLFFFTQRTFIQGISLTGIKG